MTNYSTVLFPQLARQTATNTLFQVIISVMLLSSSNAVRLSEQELRINLQSENWKFNVHVRTSNLFISRLKRTAKKCIKMKTEHAGRAKENCTRGACGLKICTSMAYKSCRNHWFGLSSMQICCHYCDFSSVSIKKAKTLNMDNCLNRQSFEVISFKDLIREP